MRTLLPILLIGTTFAFATESKGNIRGFVHSTNAEFSGAADLNGDGLLDVVLADRENGQLRVGWRAADGTLTWGRGSPTGLPSIDGLAPGPLHSKDFDSLAVSSSAGNRLVRASFAREVADLADAHVSGVGPSSLAAVPVAGSGSPDGLFDLFVASERNATFADPGQFLFQTVDTSVDADSLPTIFKRPSDETRFQQANPVNVSTDTTAWPPLLALNETPAYEESGILRFYVTAEGRYDPALELEAPPFLSYGVGNFGATSSSTVLMGDPRRGGIRAAVLEARSGGLELVEVEDLGVDQPFQRIVVLEEGDPGRILVIYGEEAGAEVFTFAPGQGLDPRETFTPGSGRELTGAIADGTGGITLLEGAADGSGRSTHFSVHERNGGGYSLIQSGNLSEFAEDEAPEGANVFLFEREPLVHSNAGPIAFYRAGDWTVDAILQNKEMEVETRTFVDSGTGLQIPDSESFSGLPAGANFVLTNQLHTLDQSLYSLEVAAGERIYSVSFEPDGGTFERAVTLELSTNLAEDSQLFYDPGDGHWRAYDPASPPQLFRSATVAAYARSQDGVGTPIVSREFNIGTDDPVRDSDRDGVPDWVELHQGLDPALSGPGGDGDGSTDLQEILAGSDPADPSSTPGDADGIDPAAAWDALLILRGYDPALYPAEDLVNAREEVRARLHRLDGRLYGRAGIGLDGVARISSVPVDPRLPLAVGSSATRFALSGFGDDDESGHEVVGLVVEPELTAPRLDGFSFDGSPIEDEVVRWRDEMQAHIAERGRTEAEEDLTPLDTLVFALFEHFAGIELNDRGLIPSNRANLAPFRTYGASRETITLEMLAGLGRPGPVGESAFQLTDVVASLEAAVDDTEIPGVSGLRDLTRDIYHVATDGPPLPLEALREFIETGVLPAPYAAGVTLGATELADAHAAAAALVGGQTARQRQTLTLEVTESSFDGPCVRLLDPPLARDISLINADGSNFSFAHGVKVVPGSRVTVDGYLVSDASGACGGPAMEVVSAVLDFIATPSPDDTDGNLLSDSWETYFFGSTGVDPFDDASGNGYNNLQHMLEGVDPTYSGALSDTEPLPSEPPRLEIDQSAPGNLRLEWSWPDDYADAIAFEVRSTSDLRNFDPGVLVPDYLDNGRYRVTIDPDDYGDAAFFRAFLSLQ